jgi:hypothetical protein
MYAFPLIIQVKTWRPGFRFFIAGGAEKYDGKFI